MKTWILTSFGFFVFLGLPHAAWSASNCDRPDRDSGLCLRMKHLSSMIAQLDAQRELLEVRYPVLEIVAKDIDTWGSTIIKDLAEPRHMESLLEVQALARQVIAESQSSQLGVLKTSNEIRTKCVSCHTPSTPSSGHSWGEIFQENWENIAIKCNAPGRNPFVCRKMYFMLTQLRYLSTGELAGAENFAAVESASSEFVRVATELRARNAAHGRGGYLEDIVKEGEAIIELSRSRDPQAFHRVANVLTSCVQCHVPRSSQ